MAFGIDTASALTNSCFNWPNFKNWKGEYPAFVGRYFGGGLVAESGEFSFFKKITGNVCTFVIPTQASNPTNQSTTGTSGHTLGANDAYETIGNINKFLASKELVLPSGGQVYVYLDVEAGTTLTIDYWSGWANSIYYAGDGLGQSPFYPAIYTQFVQYNGAYQPQGSVRYALDNACVDNPTDQNLCFGFWANEPENYSYCSPSSTPDFSVFGIFNQNQCGSSPKVPLLIYQYIENCVCIQSGVTAYQNFAGFSNCSGMTICNNKGYPNNNLDLNSTDSTGAEQYMLTIG